jgi:tight adherence protein C
MTHAAWLALAGAGGVAVAGMASLLLLAQWRSAVRLRARVRLLRGEAAAPRRPHLSPLSALAAFGMAVMRSGLLSQATLKQLQGSLAVLQMDEARGLGLLIGGKLVLVVLLPALTWLGFAQDLQPPLSTLLPAVAAVAGLLLPDMLIRRMRKTQLAQMERGVPDALDMLVICAQAGIGLEPALERVAHEILHAHPVLGRELARTLGEMQIAVEADAALLALGTRTGLTSLRRVTSTLVQTLQYGTPLSEALRQLSADARQEMLTAVEERAARLPVLLTMPMIGFILPCVFVVVGGPAVIQLARALK